MIAPEQQYKISIEMFEGPMDLLLYLIKKNDLDISDIPIAFITDEYLKYLDTLRELNIDFASEFLVMAAELAYIKSKMLLPAESCEAEEEEVDPRTDLVRRLLEYQRYKEAATQISSRTQLGTDVFKPAIHEKPEALPVKEIKIEGNVFQLFETFNKILKNLPKDNVRDVTPDGISVNGRIFQLLELVKYHQTVDIYDLLPSPLTRYGVVITFLSILEMSRLKMVRVHQSGPNEHVYVTGIMQKVEGDELKSLVSDGGESGKIEINS